MFPWNKAPNPSPKISHRVDGVIVQLTADGRYPEGAFWESQKVVAGLDESAIPWGVIPTHSVADAQDSPVNGPMAER